MKLKIILVFIFLFTSCVEALENKILFKINNEIISTIDLFNEIKFLKFTNPNLNNLEDNKVYEISKNTLIKEKIKKIELLKYHENLNTSGDLETNLLNNLAKRINLNNKEELKILLRQNDLVIDTIIEKLIIESYWNELIVSKFLKDVKIDKKQIEAEIKKTSFQQEYLLSEIVFEIEKSSDLDNKFKNIKKQISSDGFESTAITHGISESANIGGKLGWVKESSLNKKIKNKILNLQEGEITDPIQIPGGFLILKINKKRKIEKKIDPKKEIELLVRKKTNEQLSQFSTIYFNKIKKDIEINEL